MTIGVCNVCMTITSFKVALHWSIQLTVNNLLFSKLRSCAKWPS